MAVEMNYVRTQIKRSSANRIKLFAILSALHLLLFVIIISKAGLRPQPNAARRSKEIAASAFAVRQASPLNANPWRLSPLALRARSARAPATRYRRVSDLRLQILVFFCVSKA